jgi:hypothetical protein
MYRDVKLHSRSLKKQTEPNIKGKHLPNSNLFITASI